MVGVSTSWRSSEVNNGKELLEDLLELEIDALELEYRITPDVLREIVPVIKKGKIPILSIHSFCPLPDNVPRSKASGNLFLLSSVNKEEKNQAIKYSLKTIQLAHELEVRAVVLHVGQVDMDTEKERFFELFDKGEIGSHEGRSFIDKKLVLRKKERQKNFDSVLFSLDRLNREAEKLDIYIGVENRYNFHEIPDFEEIGIILNEFEGGHLRYWHDIGHASVQEKFGILSHEKLLSKYSSNLLGIHVHDLNGYEDHLAPGTGDFDFGLVEKYLNSSVIKIIEVHHKVTREDLINGIRFLRSKGIE